MEQKVENVINELTAAIADKLGDSWKTDKSNVFKKTYGNGSRGAVTIDVKYKPCEEDSADGKICIDYKVTVNSYNDKGEKTNKAVISRSKTKTKLSYYVQNDTSEHVADIAFRNATNLYSSVMDIVDHMKIVQRSCDSINDKRIDKAMI